MVKQLFIDKLSIASDTELYDFCKQYIWLSAYASNNPRSNYHWMCDATYDECKKRDKVMEIYDKAHKSCVAAAF